MSEEKKIQVVAALIIRHHRILICQRPANKARGLLWEFPGGKVEPGETQGAALARECREELDIELAAESVYAAVVHRYPDILVELTLWRARIISGTPKALEHPRILWVHPLEMGEYPFCPADTDLIKQIMKDHREGML